MWISSCAGARLEVVHLILPAQPARACCQHKEDATRAEGVLGRQIGSLCAAFSIDCWTLRWPHFTVRPESNPRYFLRYPVLFVPGTFFTRYFLYPVLSTGTFVNGYFLFVYWALHPTSRTRTLGIIAGYFIGYRPGPLGWVLLHGDVGAWFGAMRSFF